MKLILKIIAGVTCALLIVKGVQILIDYSYEKYGKRYIDAE